MPSTFSRWLKRMTNEFFLRRLRLKLRVCLMTSRLLIKSRKLFRPAARRSNRRRFLKSSPRRLSPVLLSLLRRMRRMSSRSSKLWSPIWPSKSKRRRPSYRLSALRRRSHPSRHPRPTNPRRAAPLRRPRKAALPPRSRPLILIQKTSPLPKRSSVSWFERSTSESNPSNSRRMTSSCTSRWTLRLIPSSTRPSPRSKESRPGSRSASMRSKLAKAEVQFDPADRTVLDLADLSQRREFLIPPELDSFGRGRDLVTFVENDPHYERSIWVFKLIYLKEFVYVPVNFLIKNKKKKFVFLISKL